MPSFTSTYFIFSSIKILRWINRVYRRKFAQAKRSSSAREAVVRNSNSIVKLAGSGKCTPSASESNRSREWLVSETPNRVPPVKPVQLKKFAGKELHCCWWWSLSKTAMEPAATSSSSEVGSKNVGSDGCRVWRDALRWLIRSFSSLDPVGSMGVLGFTLDFTASWSPKLPSLIVKLNKQRIVV